MDPCSASIESVQPKINGKVRLMTASNKEPVSFRNPGWDDDDGQRHMIDKLEKAWKRDSMSTVKSPTFKRRRREDEVVSPVLDNPSSLTTPDTEPSHPLPSPHSLPAIVECGVGTSMAYTFV